MKLFAVLAQAGERAQAIYPKMPTTLYVRFIFDARGNPSVIYIDRKGWENDKVKGHISRDSWMSTCNFPDHIRRTDLDELEEKVSELWGPSQFNWTIGRCPEGWFWYCGSGWHPQHAKGHWAAGGYASTISEALEAMIDAYPGDGITIEPIDYAHGSKWRNPGRMTTIQDSSKVVRVDQSYVQRFEQLESELVDAEIEKIRAKHECD